jgi:hypothetical protein
MFDEAGYVMNELITPNILEETRNRGKRNVIVSTGFWYKNPFSET